jgi:hypothetical protein
MKNIWMLAAGGLLAAACDGTDISKFSYGKGNPGAALPEGGDIRIERVYLADGTHNEKPDGSGGMTWLQVYQWKSDNAATTKALPPQGTCTELRTGNYWPNSKLDDPSIQGIDLGASVTMTNKTTNAQTVLPKCTTATNVDPMNPGVTAPCDTTSTPPRTLPVMYGGLSAGTPRGAFLNGIPAETVTANTDYLVDFGGKKSDAGNDLVVHVPGYYKTPLGIGAEMMINVQGGQDLVLEWDPPADGDTGTDHTYKTSFGRFFVLDTNASSNNGYPLSWVCVPKTDPDTGVEERGKIVVPASVVDKFPTTGGLFVHAELTHYMEAVEGRRLDLVGIWCHVSPFRVNR